MHACIYKYIKYKKDELIEMCQENKKIYIQNYKNQIKRHV